MTRYASTTDVSTSKSRDEIEATLRRYGATGFSYAWEGNTATVQFIAQRHRMALARIKGRRDVPTRWTAKARVRYACRGTHGDLMSDTDNPSTWRDGFLKLSPTNPPCPGFRPEDWREIHAKAKTFLETRGTEAANNGWTGMSLFGVHATVGASNVSACGALMVYGDPADEITPQWIRFGQNRYYRELPQQGAVLVWRFGQ